MAVLIEQSTAADYKPCDKSGSATASQNLEIKIVMSIVPGGRVRGRVGAWEFAQVMTHTVTSQQGERHIMLAVNYTYCHEELVPINRLPWVHLSLVAE